MPSTLSPYPGGTVFNNAGGSLFYSGNNYSLDPAPDAPAAYFRTSLSGDTVATARQRAAVRA